MSSLAARIRSCVNSPIERPFTRTENALLRVVDECERTLAAPSGESTAARRAFANTIERVIAEAFGLPSEETL